MINTAFDIIEPPVDPVQRVVGWMLLGVLSPGLGVIAYSLFVDYRWRIAVLFWDAPLFLFCAAMLLGCLGLGVLAVRMALETRKWIVGPGHFERRSEILGFGWTVVQPATGWRLDILFRDGNTSYLLNPIGARGWSLAPFYRTADVRLALKLGRQLAHATGWPLCLSNELERLEKEIAP